uniref:Uncharacterized protein n=1 Tax=Chromera velia CCMP2878 TaxID=1169474 RepID=A0A0G4F4L1_9ALVE|eukprot:Cvel_15006.t1-p1 / transcript=Cvel_15006.t1 / gene=Cvel_15006 / organism=Chromera_velia_CCMP2878 / gene_product=hypothetical protein / transcript_product=hypothetical protein / location=Cvel_scaffold1092:4563-12535(-) / protein_length=323 / sequence_SO=supercontig / SO=protein_coding / is_pseudo=false
MRISHPPMSEGPIEGDTPSAPPVAALEKVKEHEHLEEQNQKKEADLKRLKQGDAKETNTKKELESTQKKQKAYPAQPADPSTPVHPSGPYMTPNGMPGGGGGPSPDPYGGGYPPAQGDPYGAPQQPMDPYGGQQPYGAQQPIAVGNVVLNNDEPQPPKFKEGDPEKEEEEKKKKKAKAEENAVTQPGSVMTEGRWVDMAALQQLREQYGPKITDGKEKCENKFYQFGERFKILCIVDFSEDQETVHEMGNVKMEQLRIKNPARYEKEQKKQQKIQEEQEEKREREEQAAMRARMRAGSNRSAVPSFTVFLAAAVLALTFVPLK